MRIRALLTDVDTAGDERRYAWEEQTPSNRDGTDSTTQGGFTGTTSVNYAVEINNVEVAVGTIVFLQQRTEVDGQMVWEFSAAGAVDIRFKLPCRVATTTAVLGTDLEVGDTVDGEVLAAGDRVLVMFQGGAPPAQNAGNGIYVVQSSGPAVRAEDFDAVSDVISGSIVSVQTGTTYAQSVWVCNADPDSADPVGTLPIGFTRVNPPLIFEAVDGTPSYSSVLKVQVDELDGFTLSNPAAGTARLNIADATTGQAGKVNTGDQTWMGTKTVTNVTSDPLILSLNALGVIRAQTSLAGFPGTGDQYVALKPRGSTVPSGGVDFQTGGIEFGSYTGLTPTFSFSVIRFFGIGSDYYFAPFDSANDVWVHAPAGFAVGTSVLHNGVSTGTIGADAEFRGGILIDAGTMPIGTVTSVSITTANGVSGSVSNPTTTPAITLTLGDITPTSVNASGAISGATISGDGSGLTNLNASNLTSGTVPAARIGVVDGGTW